MKLYSSITLILLIWLISIVFISYYGFLTLPHSGNFKGGFLQSLSNWDGGHYLTIAEFGYREKHQYAFFPMYPLAIRALNQLAHNYLLSAVLISWIAFFIGMQLLYKLIVFEFDKKIAEKTILSIIFFPTSFYFLAVYSESLFFLFAVSTFWFLRKKKLFLATIFAALASSTRVAGLALVLAFLLEVSLMQGINKKNWYVLLSPLGFFIYCWYLFNNTGDPFYFTVAQSHWQRILSYPTVGFWEAIKAVSGGGNFTALFELFFTILGAGLVLRSFRFLPIAYGTYGFISVAMPLFTSTISSMPRFLLPIFPIFILIALVKGKYIYFAYRLISIMLLSIFSILFINGYWVS